VDKECGDTQSTDTSTDDDEDRESRISTVPFAGDLLQGLVSYISSGYRSIECNCMEGDRTNNMNQKKNNPMKLISRRWISQIHCETKS